MVLCYYFIKVISMLFGYMRVSTKAQNLESQLQQLIHYGCKEENIYADKISGTVKERPALDKLFMLLRPGDSVVVTRMDRLGRSVRDLLDLVALFKEKQVNLKFIKEQINTESTAGKFTFHLFAAIAEFQREIIVERVKEGVENAKSKNIQFGRKFMFTEEHQKRIYQESLKKDCFGIPISSAHLAQQFNCSRNTIFRIKKKFRNTV